MNKKEKSNRQLRMFSEPLKRQIVNDIETKVTTIAEVSREYTVTRNSIYKWVYSYSKNRQKGVRTVIEEKSVSTKLEILKSKIKEFESVIGQKQMKIDFQEKMIELAEKEYSVDIKIKIWFQTLLWYWEERTGLKIKMSTLYSIVGISKQAFHQRLNRHLGMQEELGYLLQIVREIRDDHPKMSVRKIYSAKSKDIRYRWAKDRWSKHGVSNAVSEGVQRLLKTAFSSYYYIRPENSTRYLNEFSFLKNAQVFGLDVLVCGDEGSCWRGNFFSHEFRKPKAVGIRGKRYQPKRNDLKGKNWLSSSIDSYSYIIQKEEPESKSRVQADYVLFNDPLKLAEFGPAIRKEMDFHNQFWSSPNIPNFQRKREQHYQKTATKIWRILNSKQSEGKYYSITEICSILNIHKQTALLIIQKWIKLRIIEKRRLNKIRYDQRIDFFLKPKKENLPLILYTKFQKTNFKFNTGSRNEK
ncbi:transposase [Leptospira santarosai str. ST188]|nr:hypothetical protein [Leptospira santarosai]EMF89048.1 transposase [Leptospira santarosai str. ST188]